MNEDIKNIFDGLFDYILNEGVLDESYTNNDNNKMKLLNEFGKDQYDQYMINVKGSTFPTCMFHFIYRGEAFSYRMMWGQGCALTLFHNHESWCKSDAYNFDTNEEPERYVTLKNLKEKLVESDSIIEDFIPKVVIKINKEALTDIANLENKEYALKELKCQIDTILDGE